MGANTKVAAVVIGDYSLDLNNGNVLVSKDYLFVTDVRKNLILVSRLINDGYSVLFISKVVIRIKNHFLHLEI